MAKRDTGLRFQPAGGSKALAVPAGKKQRLRRALLRLAANRGERDVRIDFVAVTADGAIEWVPNAVDFTET